MLGFMMECASWSGSESFNIQFVLPKVSVRLLETSLNTVFAPSFFSGFRGSIHDIYKYKFAKFFLCKLRMVEVQLKIRT